MERCIVDKTILEVVRDLLKQIAYLHSVSLKHTSWSTLVADLPPSYYAHTIGNFDETMTFFERSDVDHSRFVHIGKYFSDEYLHSTATETTELLEIPKVLVHGEPYASNVFTKMEGKEQRILSLIDWTVDETAMFRAKYYRDHMVDRPTVWVHAPRIAESLQRHLLEIGELPGLLGKKVNRAKTEASESGTDPKEVGSLGRALVQSNVPIIDEKKEGHSGCFAEDVAKIICWNLNAKERVDNTASLLEGYHFHLARYYDGDCPFTVDIIQRCYELFVPFAMVSLCGKVMSVKNKTEKEPLIERAKSLIQQVYAMERLNE
ncbi:hypothetical protein CRE_14099 [Caenorhabditis remanei]|uniref:CHK kinase-like domain-containing protein n=1 Tax=Caenorhabditis remanei TaxID=31234 RepID=E3MRI0_CAERE|nr:hypothetical protein CRE_14099 [Caenorhabditis remanei]